MPDTIMPQPKTFPPAVGDHYYLRHGERALMARVFVPRVGDGPFPCLIDLHGGGWHRGDLDDRRSLGRYANQLGAVIILLNFRQGTDAYPSSAVDINYGIRWAKANAPRFKIDAGRIVLSGISTGGHLAMLAAMRPREPRYTAIPLPGGSPRVDATVQAVVMQWPIINPLSRYRSLLLANRRFRYGIEYWQTEANAAEGNPMLMLERGEKVALPRALWIQSRPDPVHDYRDPETDFPGNEPERFVSNYRQAGGEIELVYFDMESGDTNALLLMHNFLRRAVGAS